MKMKKIDWIIHFMVLVSTIEIILVKPYVVDYNSLPFAYKVLYTVAMDG